MLHNVSNRRTLVIFVALVATHTVLAQVKIKERVEIQPKAPVSMASVEETVLLADDPNPGGPIHVLVVHPCTITASAIIDMDHTGGYPSSDLYVKTLVGGSIAWYNGRSYSPPQIGGDPITFKVTCGSVPIKLESTLEGIDIRSTTKTITPSSATILINGMLSGHSYTVTVQLQATNDNSYDLATMDLSVDSSQLSQCQSTMGIHWKLLNNLGKPFSPISCTGTPPSYIQVQSESQVYIIDYWNRWTTRIDIPPGWEGAGFQWVYSGESRNSTATITLGAAGRTMSTTVTLVVDTNITGLQFDKVPWFVIHRLKSTLTLAGTVCGGNSLGPLPEGTPVNLEITQGMDLGYLRDPQTGTCGTELTSVKAKDGRVTVEYWARGREPNWCEYATIRASSSVGITESGIQVLQPNLKVTVEKPEVNFGDTAKISLQYQDYDGSLKQVTPAWTTFFQINYGSSFGRLCSPDFVAQGSYLLGQYPEVRVRTYNLESSPDSSLILIRIIASRPWDEGGGGGPAARVTPGDSLATWRKSTSKARPSIRSTPQAGTKIAQSEPDPDEMPNVGDGMYYFGSAQLVVKKNNMLDHFDVDAEPDTIEHNKSSAITILAKNEDERIFDLPTDAIMHLFTDPLGEKHGNLVKGSRKGSSLTDVPYCDSKSGTIMYVADGENLIGHPPQAITVGTVLKSDVRKRGEGKLVVKCAMDTLVRYRQSDSIWADMNYGRYIEKIDTSYRGGNIDKIDTTFWKVKDKGCALSVLAMMLKYWGKNETPGTLVTKMSREYIDTLGAINWIFSETYSDVAFKRVDGTFPPRVRDSVGNKLSTKSGKDSLDFSKGKPLPIDTLEYFISRCIPVGVYVVSPDANTNHFVMVTGRLGKDYSILDPGKNRLKLNEYATTPGTIYGLRYLQKKVR